MLALLILIQIITTPNVFAAIAGLADDGHINGSPIGAINRPPGRAFLNLRAFFQDAKHCFTRTIGVKNYVINFIEVKKEAGYNVLRASSWSSPQHLNEEKELKVIQSLLDNAKDDDMNVYKHISPLQLGVHHNPSISPIVSYPDVYVSYLWSSCIGSSCIHLALSRCTITYSIIMCIISISGRP
jgi:hypothetical protein